MNRKFILSIVAVLLVTSILSFQHITSYSSSIEQPFNAGESLASASHTNTQSKPITNSQQTPSIIEDNQNQITETIRLCDKPSHLSDDSLLKASGHYELLSNPELFMKAFLQVDNLIESQLVGIQLSDDEQALSRTQQKYPNDPLIAYHTLLSCTLNNSCSPEISEKLVATQPNNGAIWLLDAINALEQVNELEAMHALNQSINSAYFNEYWTDSIALYEEAISQIGIHNDFAAYTALIGLMAAKPLPNYHVIAKYCKKVTNADMEKLDLCRRVGERLETSNSNAFTTLLGISMQKNTALILKNVDLVGQLERKHDAFQRLLLQSSDASWQMLQSKARTKNYFESLKYTNEIEAMRMQVEEAIALSNDPLFDPCKTSW